MPKGVAGWQPGNEEWKKNQLFLNTLKRAIIQEDGKRLRAAIEKLLTKAAAGEPWAIAMIADRLDGRPKQIVSTDGDSPLLVGSITYNIVDAAKVTNRDAKPAALPPPKTAK